MRLVMAVFSPVLATPEQPQSTETGYTGAFGNAPNYHDKEVRTPFFRSNGNTVQCTVLNAVQTMMSTV